MSRNKCLVCQKNINLEEGNLCTKCELDGDFAIKVNTNELNCGTCNLLVEEDSESLTCDMCNSWYHNNCCKSPLIEALYSLMNEAPNNVKWFCDKCIWETEKWIQCFNDGKVIGGLHSKETENDTTYNSKASAIKKEAVNQDLFVELEDNWSNYSSDNEDEMEIVKNKIIKPHQCKQCGKAFAYKSDLNKHMDNLNHHGENPYQCKHCEETFANKGTLRRHMITHPEYIPEIENKEIVDDFYDSQTSNSNENEATIECNKKNRSVNKYACNKCGRIFLYKSSYNKHIESCGEERKKVKKKIKKPHQCTQCEKAFRYKRSLKKHMDNLNHGENLYQCKYCIETFANKGALRKHMTVHPEYNPENDNEGMSEDRQKTISDDDDEKINKDKRKRRTMNKYNCNKCGTIFLYKSSYNKHIETCDHTGAKGYQCKYCKESFSSKLDRRNHLKIHKQCQCSHCGKVFRNQYRLTRHETTHTGEKPHQCGHCGKVFALRELLVRHERIHTGERPYECSYCGKTFVRLDNFKTHERTHTGEKPYHCNQCDKDFISRSNLNLHLRTHNEDKPFNNRSIAHQPILAKHKSKIHVTPTTISCQYKSSITSQQNLTKCKPNIPVYSSTKTSQSIHNPSMSSLTATLEQSRSVIIPTFSSITPLQQEPIQMTSNRTTSLPPRNMPTLQQHTQPTTHYSSMSSPNASSNHSSTPSSPPCYMENSQSHGQSMNSDSMSTSYMPYYSMPSIHIPTNMGSGSYNLTILDGRHDRPTHTYSDAQILEFANKLP